MPIRCRWPPENSNGYRSAAPAGRPTLSRSSSTLRRRHDASPMPWIRNGSEMISPTMWRALSDSTGSWKIICRFRRWALSCFVDRGARSTPSKRIVPAVGRFSRTMLLPSVDLPQPDSPTRPMVSPARRVKLTPSTARQTLRARWNTPSFTGKCTCRSRTSRSVALMNQPPRDDRAHATGGRQRGARRKLRPSPAGRRTLRRGVGSDSGSGNRWAGRRDRGPCPR